MKSLYEVLGVRKNATEATIRKRYRKLAAQYHPDRNTGDPEALQRYHEVTEAYEVLSDPERRAEYDRTGAAGRKRAQYEYDPRLLSVLAPMVIQVLQELTHQDKLREVDVVNSLRVRIDTLLVNLRTQIQSMENAKSRLKVAEKRFKYKDGTEGETLLGAIVRDQLAGLERNIEDVKKEYDTLKKCREYVERCSYQVDANGTGVTVTGGFFIDMAQLYFNEVKIKAKPTPSVEAGK